MSAGDSLVLADMVELLRGGQVSAHPMCPGAQMILAPGYDRGAGVPQTDLIASLMTDGENPRGRRTGNRTCTLRVKIIGTSRANLNGAKELLLALVDQAKFPLTWTPDPQGGTPLPMVFDCFRTAGSSVDQDQNNEDNLVAYVTLVFPAHPFGRSAVLTTISFPGPSASFTAPPPAVRLDDMQAVVSSTQPSAWSQSSQHVADSFSARWSFAASDQQSAPAYTRTLYDPGFASDFEAGTGAWFASGASTAMTQSAVVAHGGTHSMALTCNSTTDGFTAAELGSALAVVPGDKVTVSAWARAGSSTRTAQLNVNFYNGGSFVSGANAASAADSSGAWTQLAGTVTVPAGCNIAHVQVLFASPATSEVHYADDVLIARGAQCDLTGLTKLTFGFGMGAGNYLLWRAGQVTFAATLSDAAGHVLKFGSQLPLQSSNDPNWPVFSQVTLAIPPSAVFDFTRVTGYSIQAWRQVHWLGYLYHDADCYLNGVTATAAALAPVPAVRGTVYQIGAPGGTARAPMSAEWTAPPPVTPGTTTQVFTAAGAGRFIPPVNVRTLAVLVQAGAGKGGDRTTSGFGGGGGGAASVVHPAYPCTPGQGIDYFVGAGGTAGVLPALAASYYAEQDTYTGNALVTPSFTPAAGEVLVVKAVASDSVATFPAPTGGGLTWTSRVSSGAGGFSRVQIWTATVGGGGTPMTVHLGPPSWFAAYAMTVERWSGAVLAGSPAVGSGTGSGSAPNVTVTTAAALSVVSYVNSDHNAAAAGTRTYRTASTEENYNFDSGYYTGEWAYQSAASAGAQAIGMTAPASQQWACAGIEIQAAVTGGLTDGQASTFDGLGPAAAFLAAAGRSVPSNTTSGGAGGTVAACNVPSGATAFRGGNGFTATTTGGGGASGAGSAAQGTDATGQAGAVGPPFGGSGGAGGGAGGNNPGIAGGQPGGASGGAASTGGAAAAPAGSAGKITVTYATPISPFKVLLAHAPGYDAPSTLNPLMPVGAGQDPPDGREYPIASPIPGLNARFCGTYTIYAFASNVAAPATLRTVTVTFRQYDYPGGPSTSVPVPRTLTPSSEIPAIANGVINLGEVTLPVRDIAPDQTAAVTTVAVSSTNGADRFLDVVAVDCAGQLLLVNVRTGSGYPVYFADAPDDKDWGRVLGSAFDRPQAVSILDAVDAMSGGPLLIDPAGPGWLLAYSPDGGAPWLTAGFWARWREARLT